jgi:Mg-chelatase subunit ChlD
MPYEKKISRQYPGLIVAILDDSGSMSDNLPGTSDRKYKWVERYMGIIFNELLTRSSEVKQDAVVIKPRYYVHVITYGSGAHVWGSPHMDIETAVKHFTDSGNSLGLGGKLGGTDAKRAFKEAYAFLSQEIATERYQDAFPPMVFHLTDGMSGTDASPIAEQLKQLSTKRRQCPHGQCLYRDPDQPE